ncbi:efflux RND transporter periplasmic adaptor subunit [Alistipes sp.]|uniref:efflux RND transporter periplasmic adaptor subunit n=1 Tax=Alistipes sp. TaxID=1872444 RepID=UPI0025B90383|nr:efflux RND transporter periplasmic adaptor subunit [Alistipes sp.]
MKKILIPCVALLCACSNPKTPPSSAPSTPSGTEQSAPADTDKASLPASQADEASGATAVPNRTTFNGVLVTSPQHHATVTLTLGGSIRSTSLLPGARVEQGAVLATLENPDFITLQQTYLDAHAQHEYLLSEFRRQQALSREEASSHKRFQQSKAEYLSMRSRMDAAAAQLDLLGVDTSRLLTEGIVPCLAIKAPISGYVADVRMNLGKHFSPGEPFCEIVNKSALMLRLTAYEKDLPHLQVGDSVEFSVNGLSGERFQGTVATIGQQVNSENRSIEVYVRIAKQNPQFRPGMYATARILRK